MGNMSTVKCHFRHRSLADDVPIAKRAVKILPNNIKELKNGWSHGSPGDTICH